MAKEMKKKNRKLKRQVRKTIGALFMVSAIVVAALPVQDVAAKPGESATKIALQHAAGVPAATADITSASIKDYVSTVPSANESWVTADEKIVYTTGDGKFQFVYMRPNDTDTNKYAVILGYNGGSGDNSSLTIPESLIAYKKYSDNVSSEGYCLVSKNGGYLYYEDEEQKKDPVSKGLVYLVPGLPDAGGVPTDTEVTQYDINISTKADGTQVYIYKKDTGLTDADTGLKIYEDVEYPLVPVMETVYSPCYYEKRSEWESINDEDLYYRPNPLDNTNHVKAGTDNQYWKIVADVAYIGNDIIASDGDGGWDITSTPPTTGNGVFKNAANVKNLTIGGNIWGIGDYAFSGCANLEKVTLGDNLWTIGNGAFADCIRLEECSIASNARIKAIGKDAFYNCSTLKSFSAPINLMALGDSCFENCIALETIELCGGDGGSVRLTHLGDNLFKNCTKLSSVTLPPNYSEDDLNINNMFEGCTSLQFIKSQNPYVDFSGSTSDDFTAFKDTVPDSFYFEGIDTSKLHTTASTNAIAFKYFDEDLYELIKFEKGTDGTGPAGTVEVTYQVNSRNELVNFWIETDGKPENVTIPETIGPYGISYIGQGSFDNNCDLKRVTIPASVIGIGDNAFKGCHALETVIFTDARTMQTIGIDAFKTQEVTCEHKADVKANKTPELTFVGAMYDETTGEDTVPFVFAMNGVSNINNSDQERSYITCHSGWPTNIEVKYNYDPVSATGEAELQNYPKWSDLTTNYSTWVSDELPYVTDENKDEYLERVRDAVTKYNNYQSDPTAERPTDNEMAVINSALNIVIPNSVDSIKEGIFSNYDAEGNEFAELSKEFAPNIGLTVRGIYADDDSFEMEYYYPYFIGIDKTTNEKSYNLVVGTTREALGEYIKLEKIPEIK